MTTFAIGDIQGCYDSLQRLLEDILFNRDHDRLWLVGDLVNRGPKSLDVLRWVIEHDDCVDTVLGNHDLHLLRNAAGHEKRKKRDTLAAVYDAPDLDELIDWLRCRPFMVEDDGYALVHAGIHPTWSVDDARARARELEAALRGDAWRETMRAISGNKVMPWSDDLEGETRLKSIASVFARMRTCSREGMLCTKYAGAPEGAPGGCLPWYTLQQPEWDEVCVVFGHWSTLGLRMDENHMAIDTGCVWGGKLTAVRLPDRQVFQVDAAEPAYSDVGDELEEPNEAA
jgi:bis(5'-nucleosyl)-tetraphosphatase (symmetrical)